MEGLIEEAEELMGEIATPEVLDAAMISAAQKVEHYEIASYGTLSTLAEELGPHRGRPAARADAERGEGGGSEAERDRAVGVNKTALQAAA